jgi:hypothetical protein
MRFSDIDINNPSLSELTNLEERTQRVHQATLMDIYKFIKDNNIVLTKIEKLMLIDVKSMSRQETRMQFNIQLKRLYDRFGKNYELELNKLINQKNNQKSNSFRPPSRE